MPNGYIDTMPIFNKLLKPVFASLHELGYESSVYVDDSLLLAQTFQECFGNVLSTISITAIGVYYTHNKVYVYTNTKNTIFRL